MENIKQILMRRDGMSAEEADLLITLAKEKLNGYLVEGDMFSADEVCMEFFGLEPDYLMELLC